MKFGGIWCEKTKVNGLLLYLLNLEKSVFEKLNIKLCKHVLRVSKNASNLASRAELGRLPVAKSIIVAVLKYYVRLSTCGERELLYHAFKSQEKSKDNAYNTLTFVQLSKKLMSQLNVQAPLFHSDQKHKDILNSFGKKVSNACVKQFEEHFLSKLGEIQNGSDSKLTMYSYVKNDYKYENYLDCDNNTTSLTRFRISNHSLPIEKGRYLRPKLERKYRVCKLCDSEVGDELHAMFKCTDNDLSNLRIDNLSKIYAISPQLRHLTDTDKLIYILKGHDHSTLPIVTKWLYDCNNRYRR